MTAFPHDRSQGTRALDARSAANSVGAFDLADWVAPALGLLPDSRLLDVGAGTGHLLAPLLRRQPCEAIALDSSAASLDSLRERCPDARTVCAEMEALADPGFEPDLTGLTHAISAYALYYARDARAVLAALADRLTDDGVIVVVGPAPGNNAAWYALLREADATLSPGLLAVSESFMPGVVRPFAEAGFAEVEMAEAENPVAFESAEALVAYWRSTIYHDARLDGAVEALARDHIERHGAFQNVKRIARIAMRGPIRP